MNRTMLILMLAFATTAIAQPQTATPTTTTTATTAEQATTSRSSEDVRQKFQELMRREPSEVPTILALDPSLLSNEKYLSDYPEIAQFVAANPEVRRNPNYYTAEFRPQRRNSDSKDIAEMFAVITGMALAAFTFTWLIRTIVDQSRWSRMARTQSEVHGKILDRFSSGPELIEYVRSSAGAKFLESAPIALHDRTPQNAPANRIMWSIQLGIVIAAAALGMLLVSNRLGAEAGRALFAMGAIAFSVGGGFIVSAAVSVFVSKRLGLWRENAADQEGVR